MTTQAPSKELVAALILAVKTERDEHNVRDDYGYSTNALMRAKAEVERCKAAVLAAMTAPEPLPAQLLDVNAICDERDRLRKDFFDLAHRLMNAGRFEDANEISKILGSSSQPPGAKYNVGQIVEYLPFSHWQPKRCAVISHRTTEPQHLYELRFYDGSTLGWTEEQCLRAIPTKISEQP